MIAAVTTTHVLTLVAAGEAAPLTTGAAEALRRLGARVGDSVRLADGDACDLPFEHPDPAAAERSVRRALDGEPADVAVQAADGRRKRLLVADMESTMIRNEMLDELAEFAGCRTRMEEITARAMDGELDFDAAVHERLALLAGLPTSVLDTALERIEVTPGAAVVVATMRAHGAVTALVSGGFSYFAEPVRRRLGFDLQQSNEIEIADGRLSGRVREPILGRAAKLQALEELCLEHGLRTHQAATVGDGSNDLAMLEAAGLGVAFHAKPSVARAARFRIDHGDLTALLYFQGYHRANFRPT